jgi:hypothetical protein
MPTTEIADRSTARTQLARADTAGVVGVVEGSET